MDKRRHHALLLIVFALLALETRAGILDELDRLAAPQRLAGQRQFLPPDQAFVLSHETDAQGALILNWDVAPDYYLYRDKIKIVPITPALAFGEPQLPAGRMKDDPEFGAVRILEQQAQVSVPVTARPAAGELLEAAVTYQGCAEDGICYPPIRKVLAFSPQAGAATLASAAAALGPGDLSPSERIAADVGQQSIALTLLAFLGFGLLLSFTPCVLPMVPILSGIIVGQQQPVTARRGFALSATYVLAMALTYALAGLAAGLLGQNLQAAFQQPPIIIAFSLLFVALALAMFGVYELQMPAALQSRLERLSRTQRGGKYAGVAVMGALSAAIVGPCVAPPLAGALAYISQSGSAVVGGGALFALGVGMGLPLIILGTSAGGVLPRVGAWMGTIRKAFGVVFLGVAIGFLARILPGPVVLVLWALLALGTASFLGALDRLESGAGAWRFLGRGVGLALLIYGAALLVGAAAGAGDPVRPLAPLVDAHRGGQPAPTFTPVKSVADLEQEIARANEQGRPVMLDFYADWCIECKYLERRTFAHESVRARLAELVLLRADVTANDALDQALLRHYDLYGPPAVLFFAEGRELRGNRVLGYVDADAFGGILDRAEAASR